MEQLIPVSGMKDREWVVHVIDDERTANAFVTPGNRLFVYSGLIRVCGNRDALAAVMGHEIAHAVAAHSAERMSAACVANLTSGSLFFLIGALPGLALFGLWSLSGGRFIQNYLFSLPMTRKMESEADYIGLMMMAEAGFDPRAAIGYWERMQSLARRGGQEVPELLSTHPSNENRIEKMKEWMPEALQRRSESPYRTGQSRANFLEEHPGGAKILKRFAGKNATKPFWKYHNEHVLKKYGEKLKIGAVGESAKL
uniref:Cytochrome b5 heme-binding domain-containing protein n=1 Tax=Bionectria ochroleuca TaxID=29856 RepID=A0A0B7K959_BIOOC